MVMITLIAMRRDRGSNRPPPAPAAERGGPARVGPGATYGAASALAGFRSLRLSPDGCERPGYCGSVLTGLLRWLPDDWGVGLAGCRAVSDVELNLFLEPALVTAAASPVKHEPACC
eukprot:scaffold87_cov388-Prasinococcus_capsulatus_cf.AAC.16